MSTTQLTHFDMVRIFRHKMRLPIGNAPQFLTSAESSYFARFIMEELSEYLRACEEDSLVDAADALVDLVYVVLGCAHAMGLPFDELFKVVHNSNMGKTPASETMRSVRGSQYDVIKPMGWTPPEAEMLAIIQTKLKDSK